MADAHGSSYREWRQVAFDLSADLRLTEQVASRWGFEDLAATSRRLRAQAEHHRFTVAVLGDFKRGKSTFINALLGRAVLPADALPTTATLNRVTYGLHPEVEVVFRDDRPSQIVPVAELEAYVTKLSDASRGIAATVKEAVVRYPLHLCKNDVDIIDTPGLGDEAAMTAVTLALLPSVDLAIFVVLATSPFSASEGAFLRQLIASGVSRIQYVVGSIDRLRTPGDTERVIADVRRRIELQIKEAADALHEPGSAEHRAVLARHGTVTVHGVSALDALEGRLDRDPARLERSGMPAFEAALEQTLTASDALSMERALRQFVALGAELTAAVGGPPSGSAWPATERQFASSDALLEGTIAAFAAQERRTLAATTQARASLADLEAAWGAAAAAALAQRVRAIPLPADWQETYPAFASEVASTISEWSASQLDALTTEAESRVGAILSPMADARLGPTAEAVIAFVSQRLARLGDPGPSLAAEPRAATGEPWAHVRALLLPRDAIIKALHRPQLVDAMKAYVKRSDLDRWLRLDFGGVAEHWWTQAQKQIELVRAESWSPQQLEAAVTSDVDAWVKRSRAPLAVHVRAVQDTQRRAFAARERLAAAEHHQRQGRERDLALIADARVRTLLASETLRASVEDRISASRACLPATEPAQSGAAAS